MVPDDWRLEGEMDGYRRALLTREAYSADTEDDSLPNAWQRDAEARL